MIVVNADIEGSLKRSHCALVPFDQFSFSPSHHDSIESLRRDWDQLEVDAYMADGGKYRLRRYGLFRLSANDDSLVHMPGASFYQSVETNPLNGGEPRKFPPLAADTVKNPFLRQLIRFDLDQMTSGNACKKDWLVGVHQIRVVAESGVPGNPTPEGIHRDDETYTAQHLIARHNIDGGINYFYGIGTKPSRRPQAIWKQETFFDSYYFDRTQWHSVSPIVGGNCDGVGYRDIILIDFVEASKVN